MKISEKLKWLGGSEKIVEGIPGGMPSTIFDRQRRQTIFMKFATNGTFQTGSKSLGVVHE